MALSIVNIASAHPAHLGFNTAPSLNGVQASAVAGNDAAGDTVSADAVKPAARLGGVNPVAAGLDARASAHFATNPVSTGPAAASAFDYAKAIAAYQAQSIVAVNLVSAAVAPGGVAPGDTAPDDTGKGAVVGAQAAGPHVDHATGGAHQPNAAQPAGNNPPAASHAGDDITASNDNVAVKTANVPGSLLEAGGQANPIAAPTAHAVMSLLKMI
ncbi:MAG TPA: hypothetical protein VH249_09235 [Xanthobacteraceae bacterium]|nr:hypothetical protein [Xanthobacteraceae bacterium]